MSERRTPDPENLLNSEKPAVVDIDDGPNVFVASAKVRENGWLWLKQWDGETFKIPPHRIRAVHRIRKEPYGESERDGVKKRRVSDADWRQRAMDIADAGASNGPAEAVSADD
jgi:hypothetical protein